MVLRSIRSDPHPRSYFLKSMKTTQGRYAEATEEYHGYCTNCDDFTNDHGVEPDAEKYKCDECGMMTVMGAEQALIMGHITFVGPAGSFDESDIERSAE